MTIDPNAPAFPNPPYGPAGISTRTFLAGLAMQSIAGDWGSTETAYASMAAKAVRCADALIAALNKTP